MKGANTRCRSPNVDSPSSGARTRMGLTKPYGTFRLAGGDLSSAIRIFKVVDRERNWFPRTRLHDVIVVVVLEKQFKANACARGALVDWYLHAVQRHAVASPC